MKKIRARNMMYVQKLEYLPDDSFQEAVKRIVDILEPQKYAAILHDKDIDEEGNIIDPHIHIILQFENARSISNIAKLIGEKEQYIEKWDGSVNNGYSYLVHRTNKSLDLHQYDPREVLANFDYEQLMTEIQEEVKKKSTLSDSVIIDNILDLLYEGVITKEKAESMLSGSQYAKASRRIEAVHQKRMEVVAVEWQKKMREKNEPVTIVWLFGDAGTGKTRIAKKYAENFSNDYFLSGSSRDPFQKYDGENVVILDELRPHAFDYSDLLKMLDPYNTSAMASSRYFDKPLSANVFIITTPYAPSKFYEEIKKSNQINAKIDKFEQLARRITMVQKMTKDNIYLLKYDVNFKSFVKVPESDRKNPYSNTKSEHLFSVENANTIYNELNEVFDNKKDNIKIIEKEEIDDE